MISEVQPLARSMILSGAEDITEQVSMIRIRNAPKVRDPNITEIEETKGLDMKSKILHPDDEYPEFVSENIARKKVKEDYICPICQGMINNIVVDTCGHAYCKACIEKWTSVHDTCPRTNLALSQKLFTKVSILQNMIDEVNVCCFFKDRGCTWEGDFGKLKEHLNFGCYLVRIHCQNEGCEEYFNAVDWESHKKDCLYHKVQCRHCATVLLRKDAQPHQEICEDKLIDCPYKCGKQYKRKDIDSHATADCPSYVICCEFQALGCEKKFPRSTYKIHMTNYSIAHQKLSLNAICLLNNNVKQLQEENEKLRQKIAEMCHENDMY
jgi:TNF receptor-associated factor 6